ncbi:hypothetical protein V8G54_037440 [Vigna mungo]|uniref:Integrase catalytic domain-containing protein n=1 Tax=Vigna mungo TaxID=3915 RepID=A0AAQ3MJ53_VIGMU
MAVFGEQGDGGNKTKGYEHGHGYGVDVMDSSYTHAFSHSHSNPRSLSLSLSLSHTPSSSLDGYVHVGEERVVPSSAWGVKASSDVEGHTFGPPMEFNQRRNTCYRNLQMQNPFHARGSFAMDWDMSSSFMVSQSHPKLTTNMNTPSPHFFPAVKEIAPTRVTVAPGGEFSHSRVDPVAFQCDGGFIMQEREVKWCVGGKGCNSLTGYRDSLPSPAQAVADEVPQFISSRVPNRPEKNGLLSSDVSLSPRLLLLKFGPLVRLQGYISHLAKDQNGCRFLQKMVDEGTSEDAQIVFNGVIDDVVELMMDPFGNYLVQKLIDVCAEDERLHIVSMLTKEPWQLLKTSFNTHGPAIERGATKFCEIKALLGSQDNWDVVETGYEEPTSTDGYSNAQLNALKAIRAKDKANKGDERVKQVRLQTLRDELEIMRMNEFESVSEFITRVETVVNKLNQNVVEKILRSLRDDFENIVCAIEECKDLSTLTVEELAGSLEAHEQRRKNKKGESLEQALQAKTTIKKDNAKEEVEAKVVEEEENEEMSKSANKTGVVEVRPEVVEVRLGVVGQTQATLNAITVGGMGILPRIATRKISHISKDCRSKKKNEEPTNFLAEKEDEGFLLVTNIPETEVKPSCSNNSVWYLDTGASNHMCGDESLFKVLSKVESESVSFGDASKENGRIGEIRDIYYVPDLKSNKLSMGQIMEKGLIAQVEMKKNRMYKLELKIVQDKCMQLDMEDELVKKEMVLGLPKMEFEKRFCEECVIGKQARTSFPRSSEYRAKKQLELIHTDLCGPITPESFSGKRYFVSFIDDFSRRTWVYFLKEKSEDFETFKKFKVMVKKETNKVIKTVRSDRGGEFTSAEFNKYCEEHGIKRFLTAPYSPQQNSVAERKNRTILDMVRCMLKGKNMPKKFWAEAVQCAVYVQNRCPHAKLGEKTPQEIWSGVKPNVSHLKVFDSVAYGQVPSQHRTKLEDRSKKYIFIGYDKNSKAYKLFDPINKKVVVSRDVHVEETKEWCWSNLVEKETSTEIFVPSTTKTTEMRSLQEIYDTTNEVHVVCLLADSENLSFEKAVQEEKWRTAMDKEINKTWELTDLPEGARPIGVKWVYKKKMNVEGEVERYKARLVVKGYRQKKGIDYDEVFAPVTRMESIRVLISLAAQNQWPIKHMDVKSAFLNGMLKEEVYVEQPLGYMKRGDEKKVLRLKKALYGLKIDGYFKKTGYEQCPYEHALYTKKSGKDMTVVALYVDDLIFTGSNTKLIKVFKEAMEKEFEMTDLGLMKYFLGLEVKQSEEGIFISQERYALEILKKFKMKDCNLISTPMELDTKLSKLDGG